MCHWSGAGVGAGAGDRHGGCQRAGLGAPQPRPPQTLAHGDYSSRAVNEPPAKFSQSRRRPSFSHLRHYLDTVLNGTDINPR